MTYSLADHVPTASNLAYARRASANHNAVPNFRDVGAATYDPADPIVAPSRRIIKARLVPHHDSSEGALNPSVFES